MNFLEVDKDTADAVEDLFRHEGWKKLEQRANEKISQLEARICRGDLEPAAYQKACGEIKGIRDVLEELPNRLLNLAGKNHRSKE